MTARALDSSPRPAAPAGDGSTSVPESEPLITWVPADRTGPRRALLGPSETPRLLVWPTNLLPSGFALWTITVETAHATVKHQQSKDPTDAECLAWLAYVLEQDVAMRRKAREVFGYPTDGPRGEP